MTAKLPPLDVHAHINIDVPSADLANLDAVVFAATRSLDEAATAATRSDEHVVWGVGCHPSLAGNHSRFDQDSFRHLIAESAYVAELGLDGSAKVKMDQQLRTLEAALDVLTVSPRILSLHSYRATAILVSVLESKPVRGVVLHWWLGTLDETQRAVRLGCYFSVNAEMFKRLDVLREIPVARLLAETDHPFGDRSGPQPHLPGNVVPIEHALARLHGRSPEEMRLVMWQNLGRLVADVGCTDLLPRGVHGHIVTALSELADFQKTDKTP